MPRRFADKFKLSPHWEAFKELGLPGCVTCHENHEIVQPSEAFLAPGDAGKCSSCHEPDTAGGKAAAAMRADLTKLDGEIRAARQKLERAAEAGMEVSKPRFELSKADDALTQARTDIHLFRTAAVHKTAEGGFAIAQTARKAADRALAERDYRRRGLFVSLGLASWRRWWRSSIRIRQTGPARPRQLAPSAPPPVPGVWSV